MLDLIDAHTKLTALADPRKLPIPLHVPLLSMTLELGPSYVSTRTFVTH